MAVVLKLSTTFRVARTKKDAIVEKKGFPEPTSSSFIEKANKLGNSIRITWPKRELYLFVNKVPKRKVGHCYK